MNDRYSKASGGSGAEDIFVELLGQIIDRLDRQDEKLDQLLEMVAEQREEQERQADVQEEFDDRISVAIETGALKASRLADYQCKSHNVAREVYGHQAADHYSGMAVIEVLKILFPRIDDKTVDVALRRAFEKGGRHDRKWVQTMLEFDNIPREQKESMPYVRASIERDWELNREGLRRARLAERERAAREAETEHEREKDDEWER